MTLRKRRRIKILSEISHLALYGDDYSGFEYLARPWKWRRIELEFLLKHGFLEEYRTGGSDTRRVLLTQLGADFLRKEKET